ncbi:MAG: 30S ribosome-binding factor RbfA [Inquilinus sp.]|nr:30S ribosome-binding factor RbfA [Inquilinus sp.]
MSDRARKAPSQRALRVGEELRHVLSAILARGELRDPVLQDVSVTVSEVRVSADLRTATAYVLPLGGKEVAPVVEALRRAAPFLRGQIGRAVRLRHTPQLEIEADRTFEYAERIATLLHNAEPGTDPGAGPGGEGDDG